MRVSFRVTIEADEELPSEFEVLSALRNEFDYDGETRVTVETVPHLRVAAGPPAARRETR